MLKAIETVYKGYRFRSRLEARWAVFFDALNVRWEYEKEGYDLEGVWYLPDFYLPKHECYVEIKGQRPAAEEIDKAERLAKLSGNPVVILYGSILDQDSIEARIIPEDIVIERNDRRGSGGKGFVCFVYYLQSGVFFSEMKRYADHTKGKGLWVQNPLTLESGRFDWMHAIARVMGENAVDALSMAKQARFEHGETP